MRLFISMTVALVLCVGVLVACNPQDGSAPIASGTQSAANPKPATKPATPAAAQHEDGVRRITVNELKEAMNRNDLLIVDVRNEASFKAGRIKGAILVPVNEVDKNLDKLPKDKFIVTYCA